jgi:hypothetical protein
VIIFLNSINQLIFLMVKSFIFLKIRTEFLDTINKNFIFKGLKLLGNFFPEVSSVLHLHLQ